MNTVRIMDQPKDYEKFGLTPGVIQQWEDGRRLESLPGSMENWYFDAIMNDGTKAVICFRPRNPQTMLAPGDAPNINIHITDPAGNNFEKFLNIPAENCEISKEHCDVRFGPHYFRGDLKDYDIFVDPKETGIGADIHFTCQTEPYRPGTGYIEFGENSGKYYTWTCYPKCDVSGTLTFNDKTISVKGNGYHDHQWHTANPIMLIHHWLWGRQILDHYTVAIADVVANEAYGFKHIPLFAVMDQDGKILFQNSGDARSQVLERYYEESTGKYYPKKMRFIYENEERKIEYTVSWTKELEIRGASNIFVEKNEEIAKKMQAMGLDPSYLRYQAVGELKITERDGSQVMESGDMIYEFPYFGKPDPRAHLEEEK